MAAQAAIGASIRRLPAGRRGRGEDLSSEQPVATISQSLPVDAQAAAHQAVDLVLSILSDGLDHPELWALIPAIVSENPLFEGVVKERLGS